MLLVLACDGTVEQPAFDQNPSSSSTAGTGGTSAAGAGGRGASANAGSAAVSGGAAASGSAPADPASLPARLRRLTNAEFDTSVRALLGIESTFGASFTPDTRQAGYTRNDAQRVDPVFISQLSDAAQRLAAMAKADLGKLAPCADAAGSESCAREFVATFSERAYRRPTAPRELAALMTVYGVGAEGATYADGIEAVVSAVLQSPGFLYVTELGQQPSAAGSTLDDHEIASAIAYLLTGAPPDEALLQAAAAGELSDPAVRHAQAERLLATQPAAAQVARMVHEWLGIDRISETAKDSNVYPEFAGLRDAMQREAEDFVTEVMWETDSDVSALFDADWTTAEDGLARMYLNGEAPQRIAGHVSLAGVRRRGILNQGAFLSVYAHATESAPVLRGVALLRRLVCADIPSPTSLNINVVPPVPDPTKTTRERFAIHSQDGACASCHSRIDALGFSFETLDGMGRERQMENGKPVDGRTSLSAGYSFDGSYDDSSDLALRLAESSELKTCFARQLFRFAAAHGGEEPAQAAEDGFVTSVAALPPDAQGKFRELIGAFVASDAFIQRRQSP